MPLKQFISRRLGVRLRLLLKGKSLPRWGNFRRNTPFSGSWGSDRGTPIQRYYLRKVLEQHRPLITGRVLEIQSAGHTATFGHHVEVSDTVDIRDKFAPTYVCDLAESEGIIASDHYDCFLLPQTLNVLKNIEGCLSQALRVVRPGGTIIASTDCLTPLAPYADYWRMTEHGWKELTDRIWPDCQVEVSSHGNYLTVLAAMAGLSAEELKAKELDHNDPRYPLLITIICRKPTI